MYKCALDEEDRAEWYALYADALAHSGQYAEALDALRTYFDNIEHPEPYWWLFQAVLDLIVEKFSIDTQIRDRETAINIASPGQYSADELQQPETFATALKHDALCGLAWFNMGIAYTEGDEHEQATYAFIGAAISVSWDEEAWVNALGASINANPYLAAIVLQSAHSVLGTDVVIGFIEALQESAPDQIDDLMPLLDQVIQSIPVDSQKGTFTYRLRHADGSVEKETLHF
jgi:tetratricopeptide (TPR) repeat protein